MKLEEEDDDELNWMMMMMLMMRVGLAPGVDYPHRPR
jgi:uncharacterized membrane protein